MAIRLSWLAGAEKATVPTNVHGMIRRVVERGVGELLLLGETGTGKSAIARYAHAMSPRRGEAFQSWVARASNADVHYSELFGYWRGAFTDAREHRPGVAEAAHGGTLFIDEIAELTPRGQTALFEYRDRHRSDGLRRVRRMGRCPGAGASASGVPGQLFARRGPGPRRHLPHHRHQQADSGPGVAGAERLPAGDLQPPGPPGRGPAPASAPRGRRSPLPPLSGAGGRPSHRARVRRGRPARGARVDRRQSGRAEDDTGGLVRAEHAEALALGASPRLGPRPGAHHGRRRPRGPLSVRGGRDRLGRSQDDDRDGPAERMTPTE